MSALNSLADGLVLAPRLLKAGWQAGAAGRTDRARAIDPATLAQWLTLPPDQVRSVTWEGVHTGTTSRSRLRVSYGTDTIDKPASFFVKTTAATFSTRLFGNLVGLGGNELAFYRVIRPTLEIRAPAIYHAEGSGSDFLLLLEDLATAGCEFADITTRCSLEQALAVATTLARLHAQFWQHPRLETEWEWVPRYETNPNHRLLSVLRHQAVPAAIRKYRDLVPTNIAAAVPLLLGKYPLLEQRWAAGPRTLVHGDAHIGNMFFENGGAGLLDWQVFNYGQGMRDLSYFMVNSMPTSLRQAEQETVIRHYLATLAERGIELDFERAWEQHRLHCVYTWIASVVTAAASHMQAPRIAAAGLSRTCKALIDLDAIPLVATLQE